MKKSFIVLLALSMTGSSVQLFAQSEKLTPETSKRITIQIDGDEVLLNGKLLNKENGTSGSKQKGMIFLDDQNIIWGEPGGNDFSNPKKSWEKTDSVTFLGVMSEVDTDGLKVKEVSKNSPAEIAGIQIGDLILKVDDEKLESPEDLQKYIRGKRAGDVVSIKIKRGEKKQKINVTLGLKKEIKRQVMVFSGDMNSKSLNLNDLLKNVEEGAGATADLFVDRMLELGDDMKDIDVRVFTGNNKSKLGVKIQDTEKENGVKILEVSPGSIGEKAGLKTEDLLVEIDGKSIKNTDDARSQLKEVSAKNTYPVIVERNGQRIQIEVKFPKPLKTTDL
jgi:serine protease Do